MALSSNARVEVSVATWNALFRNAGSRVLEFLVRAPWDIACLQEVNRGAAELLKQQDGWSVVDGLDLAPEQTESRKWPHGAALVARNGWQLANEALVADTPTPGRGVRATAGNSGAELSVISWHAPNAAGEGHATKMAGYQAVIAAIERTDGALVVGLDSNHWSLGTDLKPPPPPAPGERFEEENRFFSAEPQHGLRDALLLYLQEHPDVHDELRSRRPDGPLEITYKRGKTFDRFDYLMVSQEIEVLGIRHDYEGGLEAGSDHGLVSSRLRLE